MAPHETRLHISGMHCANCAQTIERALARRAGVTSASVNFAAGTARIEHDPERVTAQELVQVVADAGYEARVASGGRQTRLLISGMHCAACARGIEGTLRSTPGVIAASVNFAAGSAEVEFDPAQISVEHLQALIREMGYEAHLASPGSAHEHYKRLSAAQVRYQRGMFLLGLALSAPLMALSMIPAFPGRDWILLALATPVQFIVGWQYLRNSFLSLRRLSPNMDVLIALGSLTAYLYSAAVTIQSGGAMPVEGAAHSPHVYFETGAMILTLITLGRWMEFRARGAASRALRGLLELAAPQARLLREGKEVVIPVEEVQVGDLFLVRPGEKIATDGVVEAGEGAVDESVITGESIPRYKRPGDEVIGATLNQQGVLTVRATRIGRETVLQQIVELMEETQGKRPPIQRLADLVAAYFVPAIILLAVLTFVAWFLADPANWSSRALVNAVAVLVIACPCALGLATPTAVMVGSGLGARHGILLRDAAALERAGALTVVVWDKTGTLTIGRPQVTEVVPLEPGLSSDELLRLAASVEAGSEHPLARAVVSAAALAGLDLLPAEGFSALVGRGVTAQVQGQIVLVGSRGLLQEQGVSLEASRGKWEELQAAGNTVSGVARDGSLIGLIALADGPKPGAREAVEGLRAWGLRSVLLTGDNRRTAEAIAREVGISEVHAEVLPDAKVEAIRALQERGEVVAMVGDGINDAPALAQADLGLALGTGTDIAIEAGKITLVSGDPRGVLRAVILSRRTLAHIKQNLFWAFFYNLAAVPLAALGFLNPMIAAAAMAASSVTVVGNSLRLNRLRL